MFEKTKINEKEAGNSPFLTTGSLPLIQTKLDHEAAQKVSFLLENLKFEGVAVKASDTRGPRFESNQRQTFFTAVKRRKMRARKFVIS